MRHYRLEIVSKQQASSPVTSTWRKRLHRSLALVLTAAAIFPLGAHAFFGGQSYGHREDCPERRSRAMCVLVAAEMSHGVSDVPRARMEDSLRKSGLSAVDLAAAIGFASGALSPMPLTTKFGSVSQILLGALLEPAAPVEGFNRLIAWMPVEMAPTAQEATDLLYAMVMDKTRAAFADFQLEPAIIRTLPHHDLEPNGYTLARGFRVTGQGCNPGECWLWTNRPPFHRSSPVKRAKAPQWMGGHEAWAFVLESGVPIAEWWTGSSYQTHRYARKLSSLLPDWAVISLTPRKAIGHSFGVDRRVYLNHGLPIPLLLRAGEPLMLVYPEFDARALIPEEVKP